jgi:hypothetical protein
LHQKFFKFKKKFNYFFKKIEILHKNYFIKIYSSNLVILTFKNRSIFRLEIKVNLKFDFFLNLFLLNQFLKKKYFKNLKIIKIIIQIIFFLIFIRNSSK